MAVIEKDGVKTVEFTVEYDEDDIREMMEHACMRTGRDPAIIAGMDTDRMLELFSNGLYSTVACPDPEEVFDGVKRLVRNL